VGADEELQVDLAAPAPVDTAAIRPVVPGLTTALLATPIEDHLDLRIPLEALQQILVEAGFVMSDQK